MAAPAVLGYNSAGTDSNHIAGPIIATFAIVSLWEATSAVRKFNYPCGIWLLLAPWILGYDQALHIANDMVCGLLVLIFASISMKITGSYGGGWKVLWR